VQREAEHVGHQRDESVAKRPAAGDRRVGGPARLQSAQRGTGLGHHHVGQGQVQVRKTGPTGG